MARTTAAPPRQHDTASLRAEGRRDPLRVVLTPNGPLASLVRYMVQPRFAGRSQSWQSQTCRAVGLLYDYTIAVPPPEGPGRASDYLAGFVQALQTGTIQVDGTDPSGLYWRGLHRAQVASLLSTVTAFADYCAAEIGAGRLNPEAPASFEGRLAALQRIWTVSGGSLLRHLGTSAAAVTGTATGRAVPGPRAHKVAPRRPPSFPDAHLEDLLSRGFTRPGTEGEPWERTSLRDLLIVILQRFGGVRASEALHLFARDVSEAPSGSENAMVRLVHPEDGLTPGRNPLTARIENMTRREYLRALHGRVPRTEMAGQDHVGWKSLLLEEPAPLFLSYVHWFPTQWGQTFWALYRTYTRHCYPRRLTHPYLFVNLRPGRAGHGEPYRLGSYYANLEAAIRRIGLTPGKAAGLSSHGLRHAYAQSLERVRDQKGSAMSRKVIQLCMHHKSDTSQDVYTLPSADLVNTQLQQASQVVRGASPAPLPGAFLSLPTAP